MKFKPRVCEASQNNTLQIFHLFHIYKHIESTAGAYALTLHTNNFAIFWRLKFITVKVKQSCLNWFASQLLHVSTYLYALWIYQISKFSEWPKSVFELVSMFPPMWFPPHILPSETVYNCIPCVNINFW